MYSLHRSDLAVGFRMQISQLSRANSLNSIERHNSGANCFFFRELSLSMRDFRLPPLFWDVAPVTSQKNKDLLSNLIQLLLSFHLISLLIIFLHFVLVPFIFLTSCLFHATHVYPLPSSYTYFLHHFTPNSASPSSCTFLPFPLREICGRDGI